MDKLRIVPLVFVCGLLSIPALAAVGQDYTGAPIVKAGTYVVSETFVGIPDLGFGPFQASFTGRFTFNPNGTGLCSPLLCAPGVIPDFPNVTMSGSATNLIPWGPNVHGQIGLEEFGNILEFVNFNGFSPPTSETSFLDLTLTGPLGGSVTDIATSSAQYQSFSPKSFASCPGNATCSGSVDLVGHMGPKIGAVIRFADSAVVEAVQTGVPEPGTLSLLALALIGIAITRIKRQPADTAAA